LDGIEGYEIMEEDVPGHHVALRPIMLWTMKLTRMMMPERE
jgi:hypothetical protein